MCPFKRPGGASILLGYPAAHGSASPSDGAQAGQLFTNGSTLGPDRGMLCIVTETVLGRCKSPCTLFKRPDAQNPFDDFIGSGPFAE